MKKIVLFILLLLAFTCSAFAIQFEIYDCKIVQSSSGSSRFELTIVPEESELAYSGYYVLTLYKEYYSYWRSYGDPFLSTNKENLYVIEPVSFSFSNNSSIMPNTIGLISSEEDKAKGLCLFELLSSNQQEILTPLLNTGYSFFNLLYLDSTDSSMQSKTCLWFITDTEKRLEALALFNRFLNSSY